MWISYLLAAISGVAYILACAPIDQYYLMWFAFIPLFFALRRLPPHQNTVWVRIRLGLMSSVFMGLTGYYWLIYATEHYGGLPPIAAFIVFVAFCLTNQLQLPTYLLIRHALQTSAYFKNKTIQTAFALGLVYVGLDSFIPKLFSDTIGSAFYKASWIRQLADIGGPMFITFLGMSISELIFTALSTRRLKMLLVPAVLAILMCTYGFYRVQQYSSLKAVASGAPTFRAAIIQGNIGDFTKVAAERGEKNAVTQVMGAYISLSEGALKSTPAPDALIWPETAYPAIFGRPFTQIESQMEQMLRDLIGHYTGYLIFGGYDNDVRGLDYNSVYFVKSGEKAILDEQIYHKSTLLMFGETLPFADQFPSMKDWFPTMGFFGQGPGPEVYTVRNAAGEPFKLAPSICYEGLFVDFSAEGALKGADALLNVTNDSWFGEHGEPYQHLSLTRFRSIETRLPMIRSTNTGFSVWIDPLGEQVKTTALFTQDVLTAEISHRIFPESPYLEVSKILGTNWFIRLFQVLAAIIVAYCFLDHRRQFR